MTRLLETSSTKLGLGAALLIFCAIAFISYGSMNRFIDGAHSVDHTHRVMLRLEELMSQLEEAESRQRGYLISGDEHHLAPYRAAVQALPSQMQMLREMTADNPQHQKSLAALEPLVSSRLALLEHWIELKKTGKLTAAATLPHLAQGAAIMDQIRGIIAQMKAEEERLLEERTRVFERDKGNTTLIIVIGNAVAFVFLLFAFLVLTREIAERKRVEEELRREEERVRLSEGRLQAFMNNSPSMMFIKDLKGRYLHVNQQFTRAFGLERNSIISRTDADIFTPEQAAQFQENDARVLVAGTPLEVEESAQYCDGLHTSLVCKFPILDGDGRVTALGGVATDITKRLEAERALRQANAFLDSVFEYIPNMIFVKDAKDLRFVRFNKAGADLIGCTTQDLIGKSDYDFFPLEQAEFFMTKDREALAGRMLVDIPEEPLQTREHGVRVLHTKKIPLPPDGAPRYLLGISEDITERKQVERQIRELNDQLAARASQLETTNKELESFSYSVSHDLRAPLRAIDGYSRMLEHNQREKLDHEAQRFLGVIRDNTRLMGQLIDDLLAFSKLGRQALSATEVDMAALAREAFDALPEAANSATPQPIMNTLPTAQGDRALLRQVWVNLLSNAAKYSSIRPSPRIEVTGQSDTAEHIYCVKDNGVGFDMKYYDKLFGVFQRLHSPKEFPGTGVGLAIVQRVIARHGGRVWAEGKVDEGAAFYFSLPRRPNHG